MIEWGNKFVYFLIIDANEFLTVQIPANKDSKEIVIIVDIDQFILPEVFKNWVTGHLQQTPNRMDEFSRRIDWTSSLEMRKFREKILEIFLKKSWIKWRIVDKNAENLLVIQLIVDGIHLLKMRNLLE